MNDPWDVKSVRRSNQYVSCMKINGVPLLPPLLSKECRKEMQYYKLLAKEVEKRISILEPYVPETDTDSSEDKTDAPELPECEQNYELPQEEMKAGLHLNLDKINAVATGDGLDEIYDNISQQPPNLFNSITSNVTVVETGETASGFNSQKLIIDLSLNINDAGRIIKDTTKKSLHRLSPPVDIPERDNNNSSKRLIQKELLTDCELARKCRQQDIPQEGKVNFIINVNKDGESDPFPDLILNHEGPSSLGAKSFTGSLNDIHTDSMRGSQIASKLTRQRSYTLLKPSPQLLAHLEVQSLSTGVEMSCISMSESLSNLSTPYKKRRSWDLESAKVKWSSMALELKQKQMINEVKTSNAKKNQSTRSTVKKVPQMSPSSTKSAITEKVRQSNVTKNVPKTEPIHKGKRVESPVRNTHSKMTIVKEPATPKSANQSKGPASPIHVTPLVSESVDPGARVRELYEKIQSQQLVQMATLVEKQKKEQILLQQVFEEQNNLLYKQLKNICPKSPTEMEETWGDKHQDVGPVSLSQLINHRSPDQSLGDSSMSSTLTDTNNYINHCDNVLKKSRDITESINKQQTKLQNSQNGTKIQSPRAQTDGSRTRTHSPTQRNTSISRRLNYDTSASSEREYEPIMTDRTNDTMADLNVTFPSDNSEDCRYNKAVINHLCGKEVTMLDAGPVPVITGHYRPTDSGVKSAERTVSNSISNGATRAVKPTVPVRMNPPTAKERAAATRIIAYAKGYLVRRLMRTDRVQGIVQTIKDALLCALQLHQDREGIRGADVDLHRRLIQQITAACYSLHDAFITSTPAERCAMIAADRGRRRSLAARQPPKPFRQTDRMSQSYSGAIPSRNKRPNSASLMTQSNYETFSGKCTPVSRSRHMSSPRRRPWR